jgi:hypothetical protein
MTTRAFYHPRDSFVDLAELSDSIYNELITFHGKIRRDEPVITCLKNNEPMFVYRHPSGRYYLRHFAGEGDHGSHSISRMSVEHRRQAEYTERAADSAGIKARLEVSTGTTPSGRQSTRLDVGTWGDLNVGFEIQRSQISLAQAMDRASRSFENGWPTVWVTDQEHDPAWADRVPTARLTTRGGWDQQTLAPNTARVAISRFHRERNPSRPSGWWYRREPVSVLLDELAVLVPAGEILPVVVGTKGTVVLAFKDAVDVIDDCCYPGASKWDPVGKLVAKKERLQSRSRDCDHDSAPGAVAVEAVEPSTPAFDLYRFVEEAGRVEERPPVPVIDRWSGVSERDRRFGEQQRARLRGLRLDANGFVIQGEVS